MKRKSILTAILGMAIFFCTVALIAIVAIVVYERIRVSSDGEKWLIAIVILLVIVFFTVLYALIDALRRKIMIQRPTEKILEATHRMASGDFSVRLQPLHPYGSYDEFDLIMENINLLAEELSKTEILKSDFVANVSHELKTPLSVIRNYATALKRQKLTDEERADYAATIESAAGKLSALVTNILQLNKLEHSKLLPQTKAVLLHEHLAEAVLSFERLIEEKELSLECDLQEITLVTAPELLTVVWNNLLSNAVKFTPKGGAIGVSLHEEKGNAVVKISDTGVGIDAETGKRIFDKFYQGDASHASEGNGLGLALVKKVIDLIGGTIRVDSTPGKGSVFTVILSEAKNPLIHTAYPLGSL